MRFEPHDLRLIADLADRDFASPEQAQAELDAWVEDYNPARPHQALEMA